MNLATKTFIASGKHSYFEKNSKISDDPLIVTVDDMV